jgi:hypothetical protein
MLEAKWQFSQPYLVGCLWIINWEGCGSGRDIFMEIKDYNLRSQRQDSNLQRSEYRVQVLKTTLRLLVILPPKQGLD